MKRGTIAFLLILTMTVPSILLALPQPVVAQTDTKYEGVVSIWTQGGGGYHFYEVIVKKILLPDPFRNLTVGALTWVTVRDQGQVIGDVRLGSYVEVYGEYMGCCTGKGDHAVDVWLSYHYVKWLGTWSTTITGGYQVNLFSGVKNNPDDIGAIIMFDGVSYKTPSSVSVVPNTWHTISVLPFTMPYKFVNWELGGPSKINDPYSQTTQVYIDKPGYVKAWYTIVQIFPDLVAKSCWLKPENPKQGDSVTFYATIGNAGSSSANNVPVQVFLDGKLYDSKTSSFPAGSSSNFDTSNKPWTATADSHTVRWVVNPEPRSVQESDYSNNEVTCFFSVSTPLVTCVNSVGDPSKFTCVSYLYDRVRANPDKPTIVGQEVRIHVLVHSKFDTSETGIPFLVKVGEVLEKLTQAGGIGNFLEAVKYVESRAVFYVVIGDLRGEGTACRDCVPVFLVAGGLQAPPPDMREGTVMELRGVIRHSNIMTYLEVSEAKEDQAFTSLADLVDSCTQQGYALICTQPKSSKVGQTVSLVGQVMARDLVGGRGRVKIWAADTFVMKRRVWVQVPTGIIPPNIGAIITVHGQVLNDFVDADSINVIAPPGAQSPITGPEGLTTMTAIVHSPVALSVYDSQGRHTGPIIDSQGNLVRVDQNIPNSYYRGFGSEMQFVVIAFATDSYSIKVVGLADGTFSLLASKTVADVVQILAEASDRRIARSQEIDFGKQPQPQLLMYLSIVTIVVLAAVVVYRYTGRTRRWRKSPVIKKTTPSPRILSIESRPKIVKVDDED